MMGSTLTARRRIVAMVAVGALGFIANLAAPSFHGSETVDIHAGAVFSLAFAGVAGSLWGGLAALLGVLPLTNTPGAAAVEVVGACLAGMFVRRGQFILPPTLAWWSVAAPIAAFVDVGRENFAVATAASIIGALVAATAADLLLVLPPIARRLEPSVPGRDLAAHFAFAFTIAAVAPIAAAMIFARGAIDGIGILLCGLAVACALVGSRVLAKRVVEPLGDVVEGTTPSSTCVPNVLLDIAEVAGFRKVIESRIERAGETHARLSSALAEQQEAYEQLLKVSERLEERLELSGLENESLSLSEQHYRGAIELSSDIVFTLDLQGRFVAVNPACERFFGVDAETLQGEYWRRTLAPGYDSGSDRSDLLPSALEAVFRGDSSTFSSVHKDAHGEVRLLSSTLELLRDEEGLPFSIQGVARDVTELEGFQREVAELGVRLVRLNDRLDRRDHALDAVLRTARSINSELEIDQLLQHIIESAAAQIRAESGFVGLLDEGALTLTWYWMSSGAAWIGGHGVGVERGVTQLVLASRQPYFCADASLDPNTDKEFTERFAIRSMLVLPIFDTASDLLGALALHNFPVPDGAGDSPRNELGVDSADARFLEGLADLAAAAIQQSRLLEQVVHQAQTDPLTGLFNRRAFEARFAHEIERATRKGRGLALVLLDIDHLKRINDTYGHPVGDDAIRAVAEILSTRMRRNDVAARIGGEEFAALVVDTKGQQAVSVARKLCEAVRSCRIPVAGKVSASFGVASFPESGTTMNSLLRHADEALYRAKRSGRDRVEVATTAEAPSRDAVE